MNNITGICMHKNADKQYIIHATTKHKMLTMVVLFMLISNIKSRLSKNTPLSLSFSLIHNITFAYFIILKIFYFYHNSSARLSGHFIYFCSNKSGKQIIIFNHIVKHIQKYNSNLFKNHKNIKK